MGILDDGTTSGQQNPHMLSAPQEHIHVRLVVASANDADTLIKQYLYILFRQLIFQPKESARVRIL